MANHPAYLSRDISALADIELFSHIESTLYTAVICDSLDELGYVDQAMRENIRPLFPNIRFAGRARTLAYVDMYHVPNDPYALEIEAVDSILSGDIVVIGTAGSVRNAPWGELLSTAAQARGARGVVCDGLVRDVKKIEQLGLPVFARGIKAVNSKGRGLVIGHNVPVDCGGVMVSPGDLVFADYDGVVAIPVDRVVEIVQMATEKALRESCSRKDLLSGASLKDVYNKYGVL
jgi:4-hydroxy-4-methyl-2-oxoglutarate aldolase